MHIVLSYCHHGDNYFQQILAFSHLSSMIFRHPLYIRTTTLLQRRVSHMVLLTAFLQYVSCCNSLTLAGIILTRVRNFSCPRPRQGLHWYGTRGNVWIFLSLPWTPRTQPIRMASLDMLCSPEMDCVDSATKRVRSRRFRFSTEFFEVGFMLIVGSMTT